MVTARVYERAKLKTEKNVWFVACSCEQLQCRIKNCFSLRFHDKKHYRLIVLYSRHGSKDPTWVLTDVEFPGGYQMCVRISLKCAHVTSNTWMDTKHSEAWRNSMKTNVMHSQNVHKNHFEKGANIASNYSTKLSNNDLPSSRERVVVTATFRFTVKHP